MKKEFFIVSGLMFALLLAGCSSETVSRQAEETTEDYKESYESIITQNEEVVAKTETTETIETTTETTEAEAKSLWEKKFYIDEFDRPTDEFYIFAVFNGYFSNSATTKSSLTAAFYIDRYSYNNEISDCVGIALFEYDHSRVKNYHRDGKHYDIQILEENDNVIEERGWLGSEDDTIYVWGDENANKIIEAIKNNKKLTFRIDEEDGMDTYLFDVDCTGFAELFDSADWKI